jgi:DNA-binding response OmpR family regulator
VKARILVVEDDHDIALGISTVLTRDGFEVAGAADGKQGLRAFHATRPDLVILDIGLPALDGWGVLERIRDLSDVPVLILTAHGQETDKVRGLTGGADDYLTKPFGNRELAARVQTLLRRPRATQQAEVYDDGVVQVDFGSHQASVNGTPVALTPTEYRLLIAFVRHAGQILTPDQLLHLAWNDPSGVGPERVKFTVMRLRRKLGQASSIEAVRGFGYRYLPPLPALRNRPAPGQQHHRPPVLP